MFQFLLISVITSCLISVSYSGIITPNSEEHPSFCSLNPSSQVCSSPDRYHPTFPQPQSKVQGRNDDPEATQSYWLNMAADIVAAKTARPENKNKAKNIIFFLGDGMGMQTVTAARLLLGNENASLAFEEFPYAGAVKTYCVDSQIADSACTATAYLTGVKTNDGMLGINAKVKYADCEGTNDETAYTDSIAKWAQKANKSTGLVTNTRVTHASPAGLFAHSANRDWETDYCIPYRRCEEWLGNDLADFPSGCEASKVDDISKQLIRGEVGSNFNVILGGGRRGFFNHTITDELGVTGQRRDGLDLISEWENDGKRNKKFIKLREELLAVDPSQTDYLLGLFSGSNLMFYLEAKEQNDVNEPTLWEMTKKALEILSKNENGFFLFVEGGMIDGGHHSNHAREALSEAIELHEAVKNTRTMFSEDDTLIITTADHSHTMSISGYPERGNDIFGVSNSAAVLDGYKYFTLNYANGDSFHNHLENGGRKDPEKIDFSHRTFKHPAAVDADYESHGGEDVPIYASGPWAHLFTGTLEQNFIPHYLAFAGCIGDGLTMCDLEGSQGK